MEGFGPERNRSIERTANPPLRVRSEYVIGGDTQFGSPVAIRDNQLYIEGDRKLYALDIENKSIRWQINIPGSFLSPTVDNNRIFVRAESGDKGLLVALSADEGRVLWQYQFERVGSSYDNIGGHVSAPVVVDNLVLIGAARSLFAINVETGEVIWEFQMSQPIASSATVANGWVFVTDFTHLYAIDLASAEEQWKIEHGEVTLLFAPVASGESILITSFDTVMAIEQKSGKTQWARTFPEMQIIPAAASNTTAYVKSQNQLVALDLASGETKWEFGATNFVSMPVVANDFVYVVTRADGGSQLRVINEATGEESWRSTNIDLTNAAPVATEQTIFLRTPDGKILAFESQ